MAKEYNEREAALEEAIEHLDEVLADNTRDWCEECRKEHEQLREWLIELRGRRSSDPAVDVVEIVRCKDCIYSEEYLDNGEKILTCNYEYGLFRDVSGDAHCDGGIRREADDG